MGRTIGSCVFSLRFCEFLLKRSPFFFSFFFTFPPLSFCCLAIAKKYTKRSQEFTAECAPKERPDACELDRPPRCPIPRSFFFTFCFLLLRFSLVFLFVGPSSVVASNILAQKTTTTTTPSVQGGYDIHKRARIEVHSPPCFSPNAEPRTLIWITRGGKKVTLRSPYHLAEAEIDDPRVAQYVKAGADVLYQASPNEFPTLLLFKYNRCNNNNNQPTNHKSDSTALEEAARRALYSSVSNKKIIISYIYLLDFLSRNRQITSTNAVCFCVGASWSAEDCVCRTPPSLTISVSLSPSLSLSYNFYTIGSKRPAIKIGRRKKTTKTTTTNNINNNPRPILVVPSVQLKRLSSPKVKEASSVSPSLCVNIASSTCQKITGQYVVGAAEA
eukprot:gene2442-1537_t